MKKIKLFTGSIAGIMMKSMSKMQDEVNEFLSQDGKTIKVLDIKHQGHQSGVTVMVTYEII